MGGSDPERCSGTAKIFDFVIIHMYHTAKLDKPEDLGD